MEGRVGLGIQESEGKVHIHIKEFTYCVFKNLQCF